MSEHVLRLEVPGGDTPAVFYSNPHGVALAALTTGHRYHLAFEARIDPANTAASLAGASASPTPACATAHT